MSLIGRAVAEARNLAPVPYVSRAVRTAPLATGRYGMSYGTPESQMRAMGANGTLFAIVSRLANSTSSAVWKLWTKPASGNPDDRTEVTQHRALDVWRKPNPFMTTQEFVEVQQQYLELVGEASWLVSSGEFVKQPLELWPVRPDRIEPLPDAEEFIKGYEYLSPNGDRIALAREEVVFLRSPNPLDPYRGMGPVQAIMSDLDSARYSKDWNRAFFQNNAEPGGIIEMENDLEDEDYKRFVERWREQHQGVGNAHRVAILEAGAKWVERRVTQRDMQFVELLGVTGEEIRQAFGFPKPLLGAVDDVNRANAEAAEVVMARWLVAPRLERIKQALNNDFLPLFFGKGAQVPLEFDYENPVPDDREADNAELTAKAGALKVYVELGATWESACEALGLPEMEFEKPEPPPAPAGFGAPALPPGKPAAPKAPKSAMRFAWEPVEHVHNAAEHVDLTRVQVAWEKAVEALLKRWNAVRAAQITDISDQVADAINDGDTARLTRLTAESPAGVELLTEAMVDIAEGAGAHVVAEAKAQGVTMQPARPTRQPLAEHAELVVALLGNAMALSAGREAVRVRRHVVNVSSGNAAAAMVAKFLREQSEAGTRTELGAALTQAQNTGRFETLLSGPVAALYATEQNDKSTCEPCREVDGRWLGNSDGVDMDMLNKTYPNSGYVGCLGRDRCRGTVVGTWRKGTDDG